jgi:hypothetical protein
VATGGSFMRCYSLGLMGTITAGKSVDDFLGLFNNKLAVSFLKTLRNQFPHEEKYRNKVFIEKLKVQMFEFNKNVHDPFIIVLKQAMEGVFIEEKISTPQPLSFTTTYRRKSPSPKRRNYIQKTLYLIRPFFKIDELLSNDYGAYCISLTESTSNNTMSSSNSGPNSSMTMVRSVSSQYGYPLATILLDRFILHCAAILGDIKFTWIEREGIENGEKVRLDSNKEYLYTYLTQILKCEIPVYNSKKFGKDDDIRVGIKTHVRFTMWKRQGKVAWDLFRYLKRMYFDVNGELQRDPFLYYFKNPFEYVQDLINNPQS